MARAKVNVGALVHELPPVLALLAFKSGGDHLLGVVVDVGGGVVDPSVRQRHLRLVGQLPGQNGGVFGVLHARDGVLAVQDFVNVRAVQALRSEKDLKGVVSAKDKP